MLICKKCGIDNPLGRVFCTSCGTKLDLSDVTQEAVSEAVRVNWFVLHWRKFATGLVLLLLAMGVLAMIPVSGAIGESGTLGGGRRVERYLGHLSRLDAGRAVKASFSERDINGYFEFIKARNMPDYDRVSFDVATGHVMIRLERTWFSLTLFGLDWQPKASVELTCVPSVGGFVVRRARVGRLTVTGPLRTRLIRRLRLRMAKEKDWSGLNHVTQVEVFDGAIHVVARR